MAKVFGVFPPRWKCWKRHTPVQPPTATLVYHSTHLQHPTIRQYPNVTTSPTPLQHPKLFPFLQHLRQLLTPPYQPKSRPEGLARPRRCLLGQLSPKRPARQLVRTHRVWRKKRLSRRNPTLSTCYSSMKTYPTSTTTTRFGKPTPRGKQASEARANQSQ